MDCSERLLDLLGDLVGGQAVLAQDVRSLAGLAELIVHTDLAELAGDMTHQHVGHGVAQTADVRCLIDEFANIGQIPNFEKLVATIRSREISACIVLQAQSQLKAIYKDNADTIVGNCVRPEAASAQ